MQKERKLCCGKITKRVWEVRDELDYLGMAGAVLVVSSWRVRTKVMVRVAGKYGLAKHKGSVFNLHLTQHCM